jgi:plasmid maintenance system antidote protein VapI
MPNKAPQNVHYFLDSLLEKMKLKNDAALARFIEVAPPVISKLRHLILPVSARLLIKLHDASGLSIAELRALLYHVSTD